MQKLHHKRHLFSAALLFGSLVSLGSGQSFAADGSEHLKLRAPHASSSTLQQLAEGGSERLRQRQQRRNSQSPEQVAEDGSERSHNWWLKRRLDLAEGGAERLLQLRKA